MSISKSAVRKPVMTLIVFIIAIALGIYCTVTLPLDLLPEMDIPYLIVYTGYENAGPEEVESSVTELMESVLSSVSGLKNMTSQSSTGSSMVVLEFEYGIDLDIATNNIRDKVEMIRKYLPEDADSPITFKMDPSMMPIMGIVVKGSRTPEELSGYVDDIIQPRFEQIDGVASVSPAGMREKNVHIDVRRDRLDAYELTVSQIVQMVGVQNITSSGGSIEAGDSNYNISAKGKYESVDAIRDTVVTYKTKQSGSSIEKVPILLRDMANVYAGYKKATSEAYIDGSPTVMLMVQKQSGKNSVAVAEAVRKQMKAIAQEVPADVDILEVYNTTDDIKETVFNVVKSLVEGIFFAVLVLYIFLRSVKSTLIIAVSIPSSVLITLALMYFCGLTINMMTLAGLLLGIGMLVDNSIVILENIFSYRERDAKPEVAAVLGSEEMLGSITASTLTSICIFLPMIMFSKMIGMMAQMFNSFAFTISFSLLCSLLVAAVLVPVLTSHYFVVGKVSRKSSGFYAKFDGLMARFFTGMDNGYAKGVSWVLSHKAITLCTVAFLFVGSILIIPKVGFVFMPSQPATSVSVSLEMPKGTTLEVTKEVIQQYEAAVLNELKGVKYSSVSIGGSMMGSATTADSNTASLRVSLYKESERQPGWDNEATTKRKMRKYFNAFPGATFTISGGMSTGATSTVNVVIKSNDLDTVRKMGREVKKAIETYAKDYIYEVTTDLEDGLPELKINFDRNRMYELGITTYGAGGELNAAINGKTAGRYDDKGKQIDIDVQWDESDRKTFSDLEQLYVANSMGQRIPFSSFSRYEQVLSPVTINRDNQMRTVTLKVEPRDDISLQVAEEQIKKSVRENVVADEDVIITYEGAMKDMIESVTKLAIVIIMAAILVFAVMASQFESFRDPFIIVFTIPLSFIGVVMIYLISRQMFSVVTVIGMLVLVGTIVNNGIVLVDYTNLLRKRGYKLREACVEAARNRLRPILMSTLTTVTSLIPMAYFPGETGGMTQPIGLTTLGGLTFGSMMTLFVMPVIYYLFNRASEKKAEAKAKYLEEKKAKEAAKREAEMPEIVKRTRGK